MTNAEKGKWVPNHLFPTDFADALRRLFRHPEFASRIRLVQSASNKGGFNVCIYCGKTLAMFESHMMTDFSVRMRSTNPKSIKKGLITTVRFHCDCLGPAVIAYGPREMIMAIYG